VESIVFIVSSLIFVSRFITANSHFQTAELVFRSSNELGLFNKIAYKTLQQVQAQQSFDGNPLYAVLHEPLYCQGYVSAGGHPQLPIWKSNRQAPEWSAYRIIKQHSQFSWSNIKHRNATEPVYFTGEMVSFGYGYTTTIEEDWIHNFQIFPDMFDDYVNLRPFKGVAEILANDNSWGTLYDLERLSKNEVKVTAATQV